MRVTVFHNPRTGEGEWPRDRVIALCEEVRLQPDYLSSKEPGARRALRDARGIVVVIGGDGTVAKAATLLDRERASMAILPTGGGNNIARSLGVFGHPVKLLRGLGRTGTQPLYLGKLTAASGVLPFVEAVGLGPLAAVAWRNGDHLDRQRKRQDGRANIMAALAEAQPLRSRIALEGSPIEEPVLAFEALNIPIIGPNLPLALRARRGPQQLLACWLPPERRDAMHAWLEQPDPATCPMRVAAVRQIEIDPADHPVRIDDKPMDPLEPFRLRLRRKPIDVHIPKSLP